MDDVDRELITQLQKDGRVTFRALGEMTGYTSMGVKKRVDKLLSEKAIRISADISLKHFRLCAAIVLIETDGPETMHRLLKRFKDCPRVVHMFTTVGGYNLIALVIAENQETLESISMEKCSIRSEKGIRRSEFYPIRDIRYAPYLAIREYLTHKGLTVPPCNVDCRQCERYKSENCVGCPATVYYRGPL
jgi:DNA-binding Lrp family transcriptional regulator